MMGMIPMKLNVSRIFAAIKRWSVTNRQLRKRIKVLQEERELLLLEVARYQHQDIVGRTKDKLPFKVKTPYDDAT
jgi:hypothetical protein